MRSMKGFSIALTLLLALTACGGGKDGKRDSDTGNTGNTGSNGNSGDNGGGGEPEMTLAEAIRELEESGRIPVLDKTATVTGLDADGDGLRDDIEAYIDSLPDAPPQKSALRQMHAAYADAMRAATASAGPAAASDAARKLADAVRCLSVQYPDDYDGKMKSIRNSTVNTRQRFDAYMVYNRKMDGSVLTLPEGDACE